MWKQIEDKSRNSKIMTVFAFEKVIEVGYAIGTMFEVGIVAIELTLRSNYASESIKLVTQKYLQMLLGAGPAGKIMLRMDVPDQEKLGQGILGMLRCSFGRAEANVTASVALLNHDLSRSWQLRSIGIDTSYIQYRKGRLGI